MLNTTKNQDGPIHASVLASCIDHTLLKHDASEAVLKQLCEEAVKYGFAAVCVYPEHVLFCKQQIEGARVGARFIAPAIATVVGFPSGTESTEQKTQETKHAIEMGADEIDMVLNIPALQAGDYALVYQDIHAVVHAAGQKIVKVILETGVLNPDQKIIACALSQAAGAAYVKTSTGTVSEGATIEDIALMHRIVGAHMGIKASGGIRTREFAEALLRAGATRLGTSASVAIVQA